MLAAEQVLDAVSSATGVPETFKGYPAGTRALDLPEGGIDHPFLQAFSRPVRDAVCECAREEDAVAQGIAKAADSLHDITGAWIKEQSAKVVNGKVTEFRVNMKVTFVLKDAPKAATKAKAKK